MIKSSRDANRIITSIINDKIAQNSKKELINKENLTLTNGTQTAPNMAIPNGNQPVPNMAQFDIKTASSLLKQYDGSPENFHAFEDAVHMLVDLIEADYHPILLRFIKTRVTGKGLPEHCTTIPDLVANVKTRCEEKTNAECVIAKLKSVKVKENMETFCSEIETLTNKLQSIYVGQQIPEQVASKMATNVFVDALTSNINNQETKIILKVGTFGNIKDAIQKVQENVLPNSHIFQLTRNNNTNQDYRNNSSRGQGQGNRNNQRNNTGRQIHSSFQNRNYNNFSQNRGRGGYNHRNGYGNRGGNQSRGGNFQSRVFHAQVGNQLGPQHHYQVGGQPSIQVPQQMSIQQHTQTQHGPQVQQNPADF